MLHGVVTMLIEVIRAIFESKRNRKCDNLSVLTHIKKREDCLSTLKNNRHNPQKPATVTNHVF